jgi:hypothetical protein
MPEIDVEKACFIVVKARAFDGQVEVDDPDSGSNPADDRAIDALQESPDDPVVAELRAAIDGLNEDESRDLVALAWIGRGDYTADQWAEASAQAASIPRADRTRYLVGTPLLGDFIEDGLAAFGLSCTDTEMGHL